MSKVDYGIVEVEIGGTTYTLEPTLDCVRKLKRWGVGTPMEAMKSIESMDPDTLAIIVAAGSKQGQKQLDPLAEAIHLEGTLNVGPKLVGFVGSLMNPTGKDIDELPDEGNDSGE